MLCRALDRKHRQMVWFSFSIVITFSFFLLFLFSFFFFFCFLLEPWATAWHFCRLVWVDLLKNRWPLPIPMAATQSVSSIWSHFVWGEDSQKPRSPRLCASLSSEQQVLSGKDSSVLDGIHGRGSPNSSSCRRESCRDFSLFHCVSLFLMWQNAQAISLGVSQLTLSEHLSCYWLLTKGSRIQGSWDWPLDTSLTAEGGRLVQLEATASLKAFHVTFSEAQMWSLACLVGLVYFHHIITCEWLLLLKLRTLPSTRTSPQCEM